MVVAVTNAWNGGSASDQIPEGAWRRDARVSQIGSQPLWVLYSPDPAQANLTEWEYNTYRQPT